VVGVPPKEKVDGCVVGAARVNPNENEEV